MQTHYFELRAIPQIELTQSLVMSQFVQVLHALLIHYDGNIGIDFPGCNPKRKKDLGGIIRFFGTKEDLTALYEDISNVPAICDYGLLFGIKEVPLKPKAYIQWVRVRSKGKSHLKRSEKRLTQQGKWTNEVKEKMINKWGSKALNYPHFHLKSASTNQDFILWVNQISCDKPKEGKFSSYGLSIEGTVPNF